MDNDKKDVGVKETIISGQIRVFAIIDASVISSDRPFSGFVSGDLKLEK
jgi:hypothetical protein